VVDDFDRVEEILQQQRKRPPISETLINDKVVYRGRRGTMEPVSIVQRIRKRLLHAKRLIIRR
jgi:hypothetical protein